MRAFLIVLVFSATALAADERVKSLIDAGDYESAYQALQESGESAVKDEETFYLLGTLAPVGGSGVQYLKEYMQKFPSGSHEAIVKDHLADYYSASGLYITASAMYPNESDLSGADEMTLYRVALCKQQAGEYDAAMGLDRRLTAGGDREISDWARLGLSDCCLLSEKYDDAVNGYEAIIESNADSRGLPFALLGISEAYRRQSLLGEAREYYGIFKAKYPNAPGSEELEAAVSEYQSQAQTRKLPKAIKVGYFIQVGVFGKRNNAKICYRKFRNLGYEARLDDFDESGQTFYRVLLGPFDDELAAQKKKTELEKSEKEKFVIFIK